MLSKLYEILLLVSAGLILLVQLTSSDPMWWVVIIAIAIIGSTIWRLVQLTQKKGKKKSAPRSSGG